MVATTPLTSTIRRIEIRVDSPRPVAPGAHVDVMVEIGGETEKRSYSIVDASEDGAVLALSVHTSPVSRGGATFMSALRPGDPIRITQPLNDFPLRLGAPRYVLLAGGVGITAMIGMAAQLQRVGADYRLRYAGRSRETMAYLDDLTERHGDLLDTHVRDEGTSLSVVDLVSGIDEHTELYVCGPIRLMDAVRRAWIERELPIANLRMETFGNSGWFDPQPFLVRVPSLGLETVVSAQQTILEALEAIGADLMYECRRGECGLCEVRVAALSGTIDHRDVFYSERQRDARTKLCCCVSRVAATGSGMAEVTIVPS